MRVSYNRLWKILIDEKMTKGELRAKAHLSSSTLATMGKDKNVSLDVLKRICSVLNRNIGDIMDILPEEGNE